ncbi:MAG: hypothetical protein IT428_21505 [Planctomycetaceae bacterium]|nr:hypothetical protein [Planctomycetaceae bacterium]
MDVPTTVSLHQNRPLRDFVVYGGAVSGGLVIDMVVDLLLPQYSFRLATTYLLPCLVICGLGLLLRVNRTCTPRASVSATLLGVLFVAGAAATDLLSTVFVNPDLSLEANPYVRKLIDHGHSLTFVYAHTGLTQAASVLLLCGLWVTFLKHLPVLIESIAESQPAGRIEFLKAATGGSHLTLRQWLVPLRMSELPLMFHCLWPLAVSIIFAVSLLRWYVALEWMDVIEPVILWRGLVLFVGLSMTLALYFAILAQLYRRRMTGTFS